MIRVVFVILLPLVFQATVASTSFDYIPVTALDKYGNSVQLEHATEAATRYGTSVIAAKGTNGVVVISIRRSTPGVSTPLTLIESLSLHEPCVGLVCTGVKADAKWLVSTVRNHRRRIWETYDLHNLSKKSLQNVVAQALLTFMGYNRDKELHDGLSVDSEETWARPLGVQTMIVSHDGPVTLIEPSGSIQHWHAQAIGKNCREFRETLERRFTPNLPVEEVKQILIDILGEFHSPSREDLELFVEILTAEGIKRSRSQYP